MPGCYLSICVCSCIMYLYIYAFACVSVFVYIISIFIFEYILYPILSSQVPRSSWLPTQPDGSSWGSSWISFQCSWEEHNVKVITNNFDMKLEVITLTFGTTYNWISFQCSWEEHNVKVITSNLAILDTFAPKIKVKTENLANTFEKPTMSKL